MKAFLSIIAIFFYSFMFAKVHTSSKIRFIFNDKHSVDLSLNDDAIWRPKLLNNQLIKNEKNVEIFYYKLSASYNYTAIEAFRTLANSKTKEEVALFWKNFFNLKFNEDNIHFAEVRDSLFELIDATGAHDILLSGLIPVTIPKKSVWRLKTIENVRPLQNGDVEYLIIDNNYDSQAIELFKTLVAQEKQDGVTNFWDAFDGTHNEGVQGDKDITNLTPEKKRTIKQNLLRIIYAAKAENELLVGSMYNIQLMQHGKEIGNILVTQKCILQFDFLTMMLQDFESGHSIPVILDNVVTDKKPFLLLLEYINNAQKKVNNSATTKTSHINNKDILVVNQAQKDACKDLYASQSLDVIQQSLAVAHYLGLKDPYMKFLLEVYVDSLMGYDFQEKNTLMGILSASEAVDRIVVRALMRKLLTEKYRMENDSHVTYMTYGSAIPLQLNWDDFVSKSVLHEFAPYPALFVKTIENSFGFRPTHIPNHIGLLRPSVLQNLNKDILDLEDFSKTSMIVLTRNEIQTINNAGHITSSKQLPVKNIVDGCVRMLSSNKACIGFRNYISLVSIKDEIIDSIEWYQINPSGSVYVSNIFALDNIIAITCNKGKDTYYFDAQKKLFIQMPQNALEIKFTFNYNSDVYNYVQNKCIILLRDENFCINPLLVMEARGFTELINFNSLCFDHIQKQLFILSDFNKETEKFTVHQYPIIPLLLQSVIDAINNSEKALRGKKERTSLTLDLLYFIAHKYSGMVTYPENIKKLEHLISAPMKAVINPTVWNKVKSGYFSLSDAFKRKFKWFAGVSVAGIVGYFYTKSRSGVANLYSPESSAAYRKISMPKDAQ